MAKENIKASIVRYANLPGLGWRRGSIIQSKNGRLKDGWMLYNKKEVLALNGQYQIRRYKGSQAVYSNVGNDYEKALAMLDVLKAQTDLKLVNTRLGIKVSEQEKPKRLSDLLQTFVTKFAHGSDDTVYAYRYCGTEFVKLLSSRCKTTGAELNEDDVIAFDRHLESIGNKKNSRNVQKLAGHSSLETTERYLKPAGMSVLQNACNEAFGVTAKDKQDEAD